MAKRLAKAFPENQIIFAHMGAYGTTNAKLVDSFIQPAEDHERVRLDLSNSDARRGLFSRLGRGAANVLVISEGLVIYLMPSEVAALAEDLATPAPFLHWAVDLASPGLLDMLKKRMGAAVRRRRIRQQKPPQDQNRPKESKQQDQ